MQRSHGLIDSYESRFATLSFRLRSANGRIGTLPSGGSTTSDVCLVDTTLYPESTKASLSPPTSPGLRVRLELARGSVACRSRAAASSSVRNALPATSAGRSNGVMVPLVHVPCRSGWPSGVRDGLKVISVFAVVVRTWPPLVTGPSETRATAPSHKPVDARHRPIMEFLSRRPGGT